MEGVQWLKNTLHSNSLTTKRKRGFEDYSQEYDMECCLTNSISMRKKNQIRRITTEAHEHTLSIMMKAAKEMHFREKTLKQNISMDNKDVINSPCEENQQVNQHEQYHNTYQKPFW